MVMALGGRHSQLVASGMRLWGDVLSFMSYDDDTKSSTYGFQAVRTRGKTWGFTGVQQSFDDFNIGVMPNIHFVFL